MDAFQSLFAVIEGELAETDGAAFGPVATQAMHDARAQPKSRSETLPQLPAPPPFIKSCLKRREDSSSITGCEKRRIHFNDERNNTLVYEDIYDKTRLEEWFYTEDDFTDFENDSRGKKKKKKRATGGKRRRAPAKVLVVAEEVTSSDDLETMGGALFGVLGGAAHCIENQDSQDYYFAAAPPPKRRAGASSGRAADLADVYAEESDDDASPLQLLPSPQVSQSQLLQQRLWS